MTRTLYLGLVRLHPLAFREEFGAEMQWIFDETSADGVIALFADAVASLLRQWIVRYGLWKIPAAFVGGFLHMLLLFSCLMLRPPLPKLIGPPDPPCGSMMQICPAPDRRQDISCSNCEMSPSSIPAPRR